MTAPVSCIITSYNKQRDLRAAVHSVLRQTLPVAQIIIADDGSSDGSREMITALAQEHACITPLLRERNLGVSANRDLAIRAARQPFITHLDGDDLFARGKIEGEWRALDERTDAVAYSLIARIWPGQFWRWGVFDPAETVGGDPHTVFDRLLARSGSIPRDMLLSKALFLRAGGFSHDVPLYEDWQFKLRLARIDSIWIGSGALGTIYLQNPGTLSSASAERHLYWKERVARSVLPTPSAADADLPSATHSRSSGLGERLRPRVRLLLSLSKVLAARRLMVTSGCRSRTPSCPKARSLL